MLGMDGIEPIDIIELPDIIISLELPGETIAGMAPGWQRSDSELLEQ
jgi:hypothetical protein